LSLRNFKWEGLGSKEIVEEEVTEEGLTIAFSLVVEVSRRSDLQEAIKIANVSKEENGHVL